MRGESGKNKPTLNLPVEERRKNEGCRTPETAPSGRYDVSVPYPPRQNAPQSPKCSDPAETYAYSLAALPPFAAFTRPTPSFGSTNALPSSPPRRSPTAISARYVARNSDIQAARMTIELHPYLEARTSSTCAPQPARRSSFPDLVRRFTERQTFTQP